ncbi:hypothetical protein MP638_005552 [Amoeboaphelidium occidentale]|nr:hypothetical protein MP638_005552 [Amoeboaphelidium occidentale]
MEAQQDSDPKAQDFTRVEKRVIATPHRRRKSQHIKGQIEESASAEYDSTKNEDNAHEEIEEVTKIPMKLCPSCKKKKKRAKKLQQTENFLDGVAPLEDLLIFSSLADPKNDRSNGNEHSPSISRPRSKPLVRRDKAETDLESHPYHNSNNSFALEIELVTVKGQKGSKKLFAVKQS